MAISLGFKGGVLAFGDESTWGTSVARDNFIEISSEGIDKTIEHIRSGAIPQIFHRYDERALGNVSVSGDIEFEVRWEGAELLYKHAMGSVSTAEVATFTIDATNNKIDFKEDAGSELNATIASDTYAIGTSSAVSGSLCEAIKTALEAAGSGTYTVTCPTATQIVDIAVSGGASAVQFLWKTGTNGSDNTDVHAGTILGYDDSADSSSAANVSASTAIVPVYDHTFTLADDLAGGLSMELDIDNDSKLVEGGTIQTMAMNIDQGGFLMCTMGIIGEDLTHPGSVTSATLTTTQLATFVEGAMTYGGGSESVKSASFTLSNNWDDARRFIGSQLISEPQRTTKRDVSGTFTIEYDSANAKFDDFVAGTNRALVLTFTDGTAITGNTSFYRTLTITFPTIVLTGAVEKISDHGVVQLECPFTAEATDSSTQEFSMVLRNTTATIS